MRVLCAVVVFLLVASLPPCTAIMECMNGGTFNTTTESCDCLPGFQGSQCMTVITYEFVYCDFVSSITVLEGCNVEICIQTFSALPSDQAVTLVPSSGNYSISEDPYVLPLLAGSTRSVWSINTTANLVTEGTRFFTVTINSSSPALRMSTGSPTVVVYINEDISALGLPTFVAAFPNSSTEVTLSWDAPSAAAVCSPSVIQGYQLEYVANDEVIQLFTPSNTTFTVRGLQAFTTYRFAVAAAHSSLGTGPQDFITSTTLLPAPVVMTFDFNATYLEMEWSATTFAMGYLVGLDSDAISIRVATTNLSASFTLQPGTDYRATVQATDFNIRPGDSFEQLFTAPALSPTVPRNISASVAFPVWMLSWQPPSLVGDQFVSYRLTLERDCFPPAVLVTNQTSYVIRTLQEGIQYTLNLEAFNSAGSSPKLEYPFFRSRGISIAFQFSQATYTVTRGQAAELVITTSSLLTFNASVILAVTGGNATAGEDYNAANPLVVPLELCGNRTLIQIPTISDFELLELSTEYFTVQVVEFDGGLETITTSVTVVIVEPTGGPTRVAFAAQAVSVYEGEPAVVRLVASGLLTGDIAVYLLSDGAVLNEDFNAGTTYFFRFENSQAANISIPTYRDTDALEGTESFSVNVVSQTLPSGVELDPSRASTVVNIMDFVEPVITRHPDEDTGSLATVAVLSPNVTDFPSSRFNVMAGASFNISCATNSPNNTITWHMDGSASPLPAESSSSFSVLRSGTLSILTVNTASQLANGAYQCRATLSTESVLSREVFVAIERSPASLSTSTSVLYLDPPAPLDIVVQSMGAYSYIQWYYNDAEEVTRNDTCFMLMRFDHVLRLGTDPRVSPALYKGDYHAMLISDNTAIAFVTITVDTPEFFFSVRDRESRDPPTYGTGETLNLTCSARATHSAMFSWRAPTIADSATQPPMKGEEGTTSTDDDMTFAAQIDLHVPGGQAQSGLYCCVGRSNVGSTTVDAEECLNITIVDPLSLNHSAYTILTPPEALNLLATVNFNVIQAVVWRRDGQVVSSVDNGTRVLVKPSVADLFGNYTVQAVSPQGVVYEEWTLVAAYARVTITPVQSVITVQLEDSPFTATSARCIYTGHPKPSVSVWIGLGGRPYPSNMYQDVSLFKGNGTSPYVGQSELTLMLNTPGAFNITCGAVVTDSNVIGSPITEFATIAVYVIDYPDPCASAGCSHLCIPLNATSTRCSCPPGTYLTEDGKTCVISNPVLTPSDVNVIAVTGDDRITLSCTPKGVNPSLSAVRWRANGTVLAVEEGASRIILSDELVSTLIFTLVEPAISGVYTCELVEYPSVSANISVVVELGCNPDVFLPNVRVGETVSVPCNEVHPSFNPLGVIQWQCVRHLQWNGDLSACTFREQAQNPVAYLSYLSSSLNMTAANLMKRDLLSAFQQYVKGELSDFTDVQLVNLSIPYIGRLATAGSSVILVTAELSSSSNLQRISALTPNLGGSPVSVGSYSVLPPRVASILVPADQCACPILTSGFERRGDSPQFVGILCRARSYVQSPCTCTEPFASKGCQCRGVFISRVFSDIGNRCVQDTDGDMIPNTMDPCEACCLGGVESGLMWPETPANTTALLPCSELGPSFNSLSYVKRFCSALTGQWESVDNSGCTFKPDTEDAVVIFQGLLDEEVLGSLPAEPPLEEVVLTELQAEFLPYMPKNITVKVYTQSPRTPPNESPSSPPPSRKRAALSSTPVSAIVAAFMVFPSNVSSGVLDVYGDRSRRSTPLLRRQQRNVFGIYFAQTLLYGHRPVSECTCEEYFRPGSGTFYETCVGPSGEPCSCSVVHPEAGPVCTCTDPYAPLLMNSDDEGDVRSKRVFRTFLCAPDRDGDRIADVEDSCPDLYDPTNECQVPSAATLALLGSCPQEVDPMWTITWMAVPINVTNTQRCPGEVGVITGVATRHCGLDGAWETPNVSGCESLGFRTVRLSTLESNSALASSPAVQESGSEQVEVQPAQLAVISSDTLFLSMATESPDRPLFPQDLNTTVTFLSVVSSFAEQTTLFSDPNYSEEDLFEIVDNIIDSTQASSWEQLAENPSSDSSPLLLQSTEAIAAQFADNLDSSLLARRMEDGQLEARVEGRNSIVSAKHIVPSEDKDVVEIKVESGGTFNSSQFIPAISLPTALVRERASGRGTSFVPVVTVVMDNLQAFLPLRFYNNTAPQNRTVGTLLLSTQVSQSRGYSPVLEENPITMEFPSQYAGQPSFCVFWSFEAENENISLDLGGWSDANVTTGVQQRGRTDNISCSSTHLTTFAVLVDVSGLINQLSPEEALAFSIVSYIGCSLSLICLIATVVFLITLRKDLIKIVVNYVHLNLSISLICGLIVFLAGIQGATSSRGGCAFVAFLLHYFFLAAFSWMLCEGVVLYNLLVKVFGANERKWIYIYSALGWGIPVPFVIISIAARSSIYRIPKSYDTTSPLYSEIRACWLPHEEGLIAAFIIPMLAIIAVNCVFVGITLRSVYQFKKNQFDRAQEEFTTKEAGATLLKAFVIILPLLGLTWVIGLLAVNPYTTVFAWIFLFLNAFQGVFIFFFHVVRHDKVWPKLTAKCRGKKYAVSSNTSSGTATSFNAKRTSATMKEAVRDFRLEEEKEMHSLSIKNNSTDDSTSDASEVKATNQPVEEHDNGAEEETSLS